MHAVHYALTSLPRQDPSIASLQHVNQQKHEFIFTKQKGRS